MLDCRLNVIERWGERNASTLIFFQSVFYSVKGKLIFLSNIREYKEK